MPALRAGAVLARLPVVRPLEPAWEAAYRAWQAEWNAWRTRSLPEAFARPAMLAPEPDNPAHHVDVADPRFRTTRADETGDRTSMHRQLAEVVYLVVKRGGAWQFPEAEHDDAAGEPLRATAARALGECIDGERAQAHFVGHAPMGFLPGEGYVGRAGPSFLFGAHFISGSVEVGDAEEAHWVTRGEVGEYFESAEVREYLTQMLHDGKTASFRA